jgi:lactobin A/cerein 7B family class IIb bacteriocin
MKNIEKFDTRELNINEMYATQGGSIALGLALCIVGAGLACYAVGVAAGYLANR